MDIHPGVCWCVRQLATKSVGAGSASCGDIHVEEGRHSENHERLPVEDTVTDETIQTKVLEFRIKCGFSQCLT